jgi:hypothetical protein
LKVVNEEPVRHIARLIILPIRDGKNILAVGFGELICFPCHQLASWLSKWRRDGVGAENMSFQAKQRKKRHWSYFGHEGGCSTGV